MDIVISNSSTRPIYEQVTSQIKGLIMSGELKEGAKLPSIRTLANDLRVSVITTKRAYSDLESQGFIETVPGKGSYVAGGNLELVREEHLRRIEALLSQALEIAQSADVDVSEIHEILDLMAE